MNQARSKCIPAGFQRSQQPRDDFLIELRKEHVVVFARALHLDLFLECAFQLLDIECLPRIAPSIILSKCPVACGDIEAETSIRRVILAAPMEICQFLTNCYRVGNIINKSEVLADEEVMVRVGFEAAPSYRGGCKIRRYLMQGLHRV